MMMRIKDENADDDGDGSDDDADDDDAQFHVSFMQLWD